VGVSGKRAYIHSEEACDEGTRTYAQRPDGDLKVESQECIAIRV